MYTTIGGNISGTSYISGDFGKYTNSKNFSVNYGRNSTDNHKEYLANFTQPKTELKYNKNLSKLSIDEFEKETEKIDDFLNQLDINDYKRPPLNFVQQYMPGEVRNGKINTTALLATAYEELGSEEVLVDELNSRLQEDSNFPEKLYANAMDLNKDGKVDIAEYSTSILLEDSLDSDSTDISVKNTDGIITKKGSNKLLAYGTKRNENIAYKTYSYLYDFYNLGEAKEEFLDKYGKDFE